MSEHTPGPWRVDDMGLHVFAGHMKICDIRGWGHLTGAGALHLPEDTAIEIQKHNGRLIAAAPELLAACLKLLETNGRPYDLDWASTTVAYDDALTLARAAVAKVEGRSDGETTDGADQPVDVRGTEAQS